MAKTKMRYLMAALVLLLPVLVAGPAGATESIVICPSAVPGDVIEGDAGDNHLVGTIGDDVIRAGAGNDTVDGGGGNDVIRGGGGFDTLLGGSGCDTLYGGDDEDYLDGGPGTDTGYGGEAFNTCEVENPEVYSIVSYATYCSDTPLA